MGGVGGEGSGVGEKGMVGGVGAGTMELGEKNLIGFGNVIGM